MDFIWVEGLLKSTASSYLGSGISIAERLRDRGFDCSICFDDLSKHSKCYRQISLILAKIPSRDAFPADIFNIHSSLLVLVCMNAFLGILKGSSLGK